MTATIALVDDDRNILTSVTIALEAEGFRVRTYPDGQKAWDALSKNPADLAVLDIKMPRMDGMEHLRKLREVSAMPVIFLTSKDEEIDQLLGLRMGADDYIAKPFGRHELVARIKAVLRRVNGVNSRRGQFAYRFSGWHFKPARMELLDAEGTVIQLSTSENDLLLAFVQNPQIPLSRDRLLSLTKGRNSAAFDRSIDSHVSRLRRKLREDAKQPEIIKTAWGSGYLFSCPVDTV